jgi:hypothetical protein
MLVIGGGPRFLLSVLVGEAVAAPLEIGLLRPDHVSARQLPCGADRAYFGACLGGTAGRICDPLGATGCGIAGTPRSSSFGTTRQELGRSSSPPRPRALAGIKRGAKQGRLV